MRRCLLLLTWSLPIEKSIPQNILSGTLIAEVVMGPGVRDPPQRPLPSREGRRGAPLLIVALRAFY
jgi:hypothetical protein